MEAELGLKLFNRTTRTVRLTEEGKIFLDAAKHAIETINEARLVLDARKDEPAGKLRVNLPIGVGRNIVYNLDKFTQSYPKVTVELSLTDRFEDAIQGEWDIVVRIGELEDSSFIAKKLCHAKRILCASPQYLSRKGMPTSFNDLRQHDVVAFKAPTGKIRPWFLTELNGDISEVLPQPNVIFNDGRTLVDGIVSGLGIGQVYDKAIGSAIKSGELVELLPDSSTQGPPISALIPSGRVMPAKTKAFIEFLKQELA